MALELRRVADGDAVLVVGGAVVPTGAEPGVAALIEEEPCELGVAPVAGLAVELDEPHLDLGVAGGARVLPGAEAVDEVVSEAARDPEEAVVPVAR